MKANKITKASKKAGKKKKSRNNNNNMTSTTMSAVKFNPINLAAKPDLLRLHNESLSKYLHGILEPETTVQTQSVVKQPSLVPIPSTTISFRNNVNISTDANGDFFLAWNPNFFANQQVLDAFQMTQTTATPPKSENLNALGHIAFKDSNHLRFIPTYCPDIDLSKYRLVSAKIKVSYIGSVLNKSGMMYACATFDQTAVAVGRLNVPNSIMQLWTGSTPTEMTFPNAGYPLFDRTFRQLDEQLISNGIWNKSVNITNTNQGITCLHVPTDPVNEIFYPIGTYFGESITNTTVSFDPSGPNGIVAPVQLRSLQGSQLCYLINGHGLPASVECVNLQVFYNFEIIPTPASAPFLRSSINDVTPDLVNDTKMAITQIIPKIAVRDTVTPMSKSFLGSLTSKLPRIVSLGKSLSDLASIYTSFLK